MLRPNGYLDTLKCLLVASTALFLSLLSGCSFSDLFPPKIDNQVAYFNTYYNASRLYKEAILEIENTEKSSRQRGLPPPKEISPNVRQKFTTVIEKCSKLLMYYPNSKWVDDALMLIGKSYYYMGEYTKAERKFNELITELPNSDLLLDAQLWLGKTFRRDNNLDQAARELKSAAETALAQSEGSVAAEALLTLGEIHAERKSYQEAIDAYQDLITRSDYDESKAQAQFRIGELYEETEDYTKATAAFKKVLAYKPDTYLSYQAQTRYAINATRIEQYDEALKVLYGLLDDDSNSPYHSNIKLEIANTLKDKGDIDRAIEAYEIIDTAYAKTDVAARGYYQLGLLFEKVLHDYSAADTNYLRARTEFPPSPVAALASHRGENLHRYSSYQRVIRNTDSLLVRELLSHETRTDSSRAPKQDSTSVTGPAQVDSSSRLHFELWTSTKRSPAIDNLKLALGRSCYDLGTLFFLDLEEPDSALFWCNKTIGVSPDSELVARTLFTVVEIHRTYGRGDQSVRDSLYRRIISDYPQTKYAVEVRRLLGIQEETKAEDPAAVLYKDAEKLLQENRSTEAIALLHKLIENFPSSPFTPKAQYAVGWIFENIEKRSDSALANYKTLMTKYPASTYAAAVGPRVVQANQKEMQEEAQKDSATMKQDRAVENKLPSSENQPKVVAPADTSLQDVLKKEGEVEDSLRIQRRVPPFKRTRPDTSKIIKE